MNIFVILTPFLAIKERWNERFEGANKWQVERGQGLTIHVCRSGSGTKQSQLHVYVVSRGWKNMGKVRVPETILGTRQGNRAMSFKKVGG